MTRNRTKEIAEALMQLQPRYSLLTLLVLTVLVAGGVKLWYGPHHAVERTMHNQEIEYAYTRDWRGNKIVSGPRILRWVAEDGTPEQIEVNYLRAGLDLHATKVILASKALQEFSKPLIHYFEAQIEIPMTTPEQEEFDRTMAAEVADLQRRGLTQNPLYFSNLSGRPGDLRE
jgi:hypothetical protein